MKLVYVKFWLLFLTVVLSAPALAQDSPSNDDPSGPASTTTPLAGAVEGESANSSSGPADDGSMPEEPIGEEPDETSREIFLRGTTILLEPKEVELEFDLTYLRDQLLAVTRFRQVSFTTALRVGVFRRLEAFVNIPFNWAQEEVFNSRGELLEDDDSGIGDITAGANFLLVPESLKWPDIIGSLSVTEPTGQKPDPNDPTVIALGQGRRSLTAGITLVRSTDPAVLFGGIQFAYLDKETLGDVEIEGGHQFTYTFGTGFALNDELTLSGTFVGVYQTELKLDGEEIRGSDFEPMALQTSLTYQITKRAYIEPSMTFGLNEDAIDSILNIAYFFRF